MSINPAKASINGAIAIVGGIILLAISFSCFVIVSPGTVGVVTHFGAVQDEILPEGLHFKIPVKTKVIPIDVRIQKIEVRATASSKDLQNVSSLVALNFYVEKEQANTVFQELGENYRRTIIMPGIQESVKSATAQYNAEQLITQRSMVKDSIFEVIKRRLNKYSIIVTDFSIIDFRFSAEFDKAIEEKQVAEQRALRAKNDLNRIKTEAEQARARAEGEAQAKLAIARAEAEAQRLLRETLSSDIIRLRTIQKWDGALPKVSGSAGGTLIDMSALMGPKKK